MISNAQLLFNKLCDVFPDAIQEITKLSRNESNKKDFIISNETAFNFDLVWNVSPSHSEKKERSPDAIFVKNNSIYFVEFKEGGYDRSEIRQKIHEGLNTLFQFCRQHNIIGINDFINIEFNYAIIHRESGKNKGFSDALRHAICICDLRNMEGFLIKKAVSSCKIDGILKILNVASNGRIFNIEICSKEQDSFLSASC